MIFLVKKSKKDYEAICVINSYVSGDYDIYTVSIRANAVSRGLLEYLNSHFCETGQKISSDFIDDLHSITEGLVQRLQDRVQFNIYLSYEDAEELNSKICDAIQEFLDDFAKKYNLVILKM